MTPLRRSPLLSSTHTVFFRLISFSLFFISLVPLLSPSPLPSSFRSPFSPLPLLSSFSSSSQSQSTTSSPVMTRNRPCSTYSQSSFHTSGVIEPPAFASRMRSMRVESSGRDQNLARWTFRFVPIQWGEKSNWRMLMSSARHTMMALNVLVLLPLLLLLPSIHQKI